MHSHDSDRSILQGRSIPDLYDLYDPYDLYCLDHVAGWEPNNDLHDRSGHLSWVGFVCYTDAAAHCTTYHSGTKRQPTQGGGHAIV